MRPTLTVAVIVLLFISCSSPTGKDNLMVVAQPAEFQQQEAIWLIWPSTEYKKGESIENVTLSIIKAIKGQQNIIISCKNATLLNHARDVIINRFGDLKNITLVELPSFDIWVRDMGPIFVKTNQDKMAIADFNFNSWGYSDTLAPDNITEEMYDERVGNHLKLPVVSSSMISEGGNHEVNGKGTLMITEAVEMNRNPNMNKEQMETEYKRLLGVKKIIWLQQGLVEDDHSFRGPVTTPNGQKAYTVITTNGHIDEFARFVNDSTILLAQVDSAVSGDPIAAENFKRIEENYKILAAATDQDGKPFTIVRLPLNRTVYSTLSPGDWVYDYLKTLNYQDGSSFPDGDTIKVIAALSYLNFIITNKVIIGQSCWREGMPDELKLQDEKALKVLQSVFPGRKVIMIDALAVNLGGGGLHCISMQQPAL